MRVLILMMASAALLSAGGPQTPARSKPKAAAAPAKAKTNVSAPPEIPAAAVETETGTYKYTDPQGRKWIYRKTPFGISRLEDKPPSEAGGAGPVDRLANAKAIEDGDSVRFEVPTPFGVHKWQKKKSELDEMEQAAWTRALTQAKAQAKPEGNPRTGNGAAAKQD